MNYVCLPVEEAVAVPMKCLGQDAENLRVSLHKCPDFGDEVEIFSNEIRARCSTKMFRIGKG